MCVFVWHATILIGYELQAMGVKREMCVISCNLTFGGGIWCRNMKCTSSKFNTNTTRILRI